MGFCREAHTTQQQCSSSSSPHSPSPPQSRSRRPLSQHGCPRTPLSPWPPRRRRRCPLATPLRTSSACFLLWDSGTLRALPQTATWRLSTDAVLSRSSTAALPSLLLSATLCHFSTSSLATCLSLRTSSLRMCLLASALWQLCQWPAGGRSSPPPAFSRASSSCRRTTPHQVTWAATSGNVTTILK